MSDSDGRVDDITEHWPEGIQCPACHVVNRPQPSLFAAFFDTGGAPCWSCKMEFDPWTTAVRELSDWPNPWVAFRLIGAHVTKVRVRLQADRNVRVDLSPVPSEAEFLNATIGVIVRGDPGEPHVMMPALNLGSTELRFDPFPRNHLYLYGMAYGHKDVAESDAYLAITWVGLGPEEVPMHHLADAAKSFAAGRFKQMLVPANIAAEAALTPAVRMWLARYRSRQRRDAEFGGLGGRGYSKQFAVLARMETARGPLGVKALPKAIRASLDDLRQYRNDMVHAGAINEKKRSAPDKRKAAEFLVAAVFGGQYARYLLGRPPP